MIGFETAEIRTDQPTRNARLKWVIVIDESLPPGRAANAAICVAAATTAGVGGLLGPDAEDAAGVAHPGLPWAGCSVLGAPAARLTGIRERAAASLGVFVADMAVAGHTTRIYDEYLAEVGKTDTGDLSYLALSLVGPKNRIDKLVHRLSLLQ